MKIATRIDDLEQISNGALVPWLSRMKALGVAQSGNIEATAREMGAPAELAAKLKAAVGAETTDGAPGLAGSSAAVVGFISQMRTQSVLARIFSERWAMQVPFNTRLMSIGLEANAAVVGGGLPIPVQGLPWDDPLIVNPEKIAAALVLTNELWNNTSAAGQSFVNVQLRAAIAAACDRFLFTKLTSGGTFDGTVNTQLGRPDPDGLHVALLAALNRVNTRAAGNLVWAVSPQAANMLALLDDDTLNPFGGTIAKIPAVMTSAFTGSRLSLIDAAAIGGNIERLEITSSDEAAIEMADDPTNTSATPSGTNLVSMFQTNSTVVKYVLNLGLEPVRDDAAAFISFEEYS
ncbi:phage major capsid protein [Salipiger sp. 1_MG-2023]|uniref:phage major capsid protein n=1 Tax=Salipiger sp. 1_MG-2023 TaxID=3062665 RepID=UPI0026E15A73|nr:phage major capsid protein [Salipiger sp. 1_MG-2023]MDO6584811.1 phage major capsid protein [Salipiger sp. 1_MG-2023]